MLHGGGRSMRYCLILLSVTDSLDQLWMRPAIIKLSYNVFPASPLIFQNHTNDDSSPESNNNTRKAISKKVVTDDVYEAAALAITDAVSPEGFDDPRLEDTAEYRKKMGRWRKDVLKIVRLQLFWLIVRLVQAAHAKVMVHFFFMDKKRDAEEIEKRGTGLAQLICGKGEAILRGFDKVMEPG